MPLQGFRIPAQPARARVEGAGSVVGLEEAFFSLAEALVIEQGIAAKSESALTFPSIVAPELIADQYCASVIGIVYHWISDPENLDEMRARHNGLKKVMRVMLAEHK